MRARRVPRAEQPEHYLIPRGIGKVTGGEAGASTIPRTFVQENAMDFDSSFIGSPADGHRKVGDVLFRHARIGAIRPPPTLSDNS
jgi:hypothetical protein